MSLVIIFWLVSKTLIQTTTIFCECVHLKEKENCVNSGKCRWNEDDQSCIENTRFQTQNIVYTYCSQFIEDECIYENKCAFHLGKCIEFKNCEAFTKEKCNQSSYYCINEGNKCISKGLCSDYLTQIACQNKNSQGKYCKWIHQDDQYFCEDIKNCEDLPSLLKFDRDCREQIKTCTISLNGGCQISSQFCSQYRYQEQCYFNFNQVECFWDDNLNQCFEKICKNLQSSLFEECQKIQPICTTNGVQCIEKLNCNQYQNSNSCIEDLERNKCIFYKDRCYEQNCRSAPNFISTLMECQFFEFKDVKCIPRKQGGCKIIPQKCDELETEDSCRIIQELNGKQCYWQQQQQICKFKQCSDAPTEYNHIKCISWLSDYECIGGIENGCIENVDDCTNIINLKSCFKDKFNRQCVIENDKCVEEKCQNFKFPFYDNIYACEKKLEICTYSLYHQMCIKKECSELENRQCNFDYQMNKCIQLPGCIHKKCESASIYYRTNEECENWDIRCTINAGIINNINYQNGCITKHLDCIDFKYQSQCLTQLQGIPCFWNQSINQCQFHNCQNAPKSLKTLIECQQWVQYHNIKCINKENGGCIEQSKNCNGLNDEVQCQVGSIEGLCFWNTNNRKCEDRTCDNANNVNSNKQCRQWLQSCIFKEKNKCESYNNYQKLCSQFPINMKFDSHEECQAWNPNCTLKLGQACFTEDLCNKYKTQELCKFNSNGDQCKWNATNQCEENKCENLTNPNDDNSCFQHSPTCTIRTTTIDGVTIKTCIIRQQKCNTILNQKECENHSQQEKCVWNSFGQCSAVICIYNSQDSKCEDNNLCQIENPTYSNCKEKNEQCILNELESNCQLIQSCQDTTTYSDYNCEKIKYNKSCQKWDFQSGCQILAENCSDYKYQEICIMNYTKKQCYWSILKNKCLNFSCSVIEEKLNSHNDCQNISLKCTLNVDIDIQSNCMELKLCKDYRKREQCYIDINKQQCSWIKNKCIFDKCKTVPLDIYTIEKCQNFGIECTINEDRSGCITKLDLCEQYNKLQCLTPNQSNYDEIQCFWDQSSNDCKEIICHKANKQILEQIECEQFNYNCQTKQCKISICMDYEYSSDIECSQVLIKNKCTTDGKQCVNRNQCQDVIDKAGCTYSINFQDCIWLQNENRCVDKNCNSALTSFISHQQCQNYLQQCTNRIGGGCVNITTCNSISFEDACFYDQFNQDCLWDNMNKKCINLECSTFCGDGIVGDLEQCDDGNLLPYDGCYKCKFQCYYGCNNCIELRCQECDQGFQLNFDGSCTEICGDGFIVGLEECDDMNNIQNDGCYLCKFQCHQQCLDCIFGFCNQCAFGWEQYNNQCQSICGNGLLVEQFEQCDDGNNQDDDGCNSKCQIEKNWICFQSQINQITECKKDLKPKIILQNISQKKDSTQIIQLQFNQQLQLKNNTRFEDFIKINVTGNVEFHLIIEPIFAAQLYLTNIVYNIHITLLEKVDSPYVTIQFTQSILINEQNQELIQLIDTISLGTPSIISLQQQSRLNNTIAFNQIMIYVFIGSSSLSLLTGNFDLFFNMLALLQQLSYTRYLSVQFPNHLDQYLKVFKVVSFQPLYDQLNIDSLFQQLNFGKVPFIQSKNNVKQDSEFNNSFFLVNAKSFYITMFVSIFLYFLSKFINLIRPFLYVGLLKITKFKQLKILYKLFKLLKVFALKTSHYFIYSGIIKTFISCQFQLMYSAYIQFPEYKFSFEIENLFETFNSFNALISIIIPHIFLFKSVTLLKKQYKSSTNNKYSIFYENVNQDYWSRFFIPFSMIKVNIYMAIICFLFDSPIVQIISLTILCSFFCYYIIAVRPTNSKVELLRLLIKEIFFLIIISSFFPYCINFYEDFITVLGWIHIGLFSFILASNILLDSIKQIYHLLMVYEKNQTQIKRREQVQLIKNVLQKVVYQNQIQQNIYKEPLSIGYEVQSNYSNQIQSLH